MHGRLPHSLASGPVGRGEFSCEDTSDLFSIVQRDIEEKTGTYALGDFQHLFPHRITLAVAETGLGVSQILSPMVAHDGVHMCHARHDAFRATAESCEEMRFDEPRDDADIGFHTVSIDPSWNTGSCCSEGNTRVVVEGFMVEDPPVRHHFGREQLLEFFSGAGSVGAQLAEQGDLISLHSGLFQISQKPRNQSFIGGGPSDVCEEDANAATGREPLPQWGGAER